ncbi:hypothetical protein JOC58_004403 [Paenibacillus hunanensis]|uniref:Uncharacterized protein n=1 Tax=Paenibacillus hunanensis TaxID=539262 RepID=A0ABU1J4N0_9BACL|nr:hypothetical protein [Paenibacillus hunanensis]
MNVYICSFFVCLFGFDRLTQERARTILFLSKIHHKMHLSTK